MHSIAAAEPPWERTRRLNWLKRYQHRRPLFPKAATHTHNIMGCKTHTGTKTEAERRHGSTSGSIIAVPLAAQTSTEQYDIVGGYPP